MAKDALVIFEGVKNKKLKKLQQNQYCCARDHLFSRIHFSNACRSGVTANMTITEFNNGKTLSDGRYIVI